MNILVVESDKFVGSSFCRLLRHWGYNVTRASTGQEGLQKARGVEPGVVILNAALEDMRASELIRRIKDKAPDTKIVVMTGHNTARLERSIRKLGVVYYMTNLIPDHDLKSVLDHIS